MHLPYRKLIIALFISLFFSFSIKTSFAQITATGVAVTLPVEGENIENGSLICTSATQITSCEHNYAAEIYGVVTTNPAAAFESDLVEENSYQVVSSGKAQVRVNGQNGTIVSGDLLTSSQTPGVAMKATHNGYVLGTALDDFDQTGDTEGTILVSINIHPSTAFTNDRSSLIELLRQGLASALLTPLSALRYILAGIVSVAAFLLGLIYFGRLARSGVEAIGRNPLAQRTIQMTIFINVFVMVVIVAAGFGIAYMILAL